MATAVLRCKVALLLALCVDAYLCFLPAGEASCPFRHRLGQRRPRKLAVQPSTFSMPAKAISALTLTSCCSSIAIYYHTDFTILFTRDS